MLSNWEFPSSFSLFYLYIHENGIRKLYFCFLDISFPTV